MALKKCAECGGKLPDWTERYGKRCIRCWVAWMKWKGVLAVEPFLGTEPGVLPADLKMIPIREDPIGEDR